MASLKELRTRIASVKSTRKITSAMKMVAASKLRRAQEAAEASRPYAGRMGGMLTRLARATGAGDGAPGLLAGTGRDDVHLLVVFTADRGLCGAFNSAVIRMVRRRILELRKAGRTVRLLFVGRKAADALKADFGDLFVDTVTGLGGKRGVSFAEADAVGAKLIALLQPVRLGDLPDSDRTPTGAVSGAGARRGGGKRAFRRPRIRAERGNHPGRPAAA